MKDDINAHDILVLHLNQNRLVGNEVKNHHYSVRY